MIQTYKTNLKDTLDMVIKFLKDIQKEREIK